MEFPDRYHLELQPILGGYDRKTCWVQARAGAIPTQPGCVVMTMQKLLLTGSDVFYELNEMRTDDGGETWSEPIAHSETLGRRPAEEGMETVVCDFCPQWHAASGTLLGTGHSVKYRNNEVDHDGRREIAYSAYHPETRTWNPWDTVDMPDEDIFYRCGSGCSQRWDHEDGTILLPMYCRRKNDTATKVAVVRCGFDGTKLTYLERGTFLERNEDRGLAEASLAKFAGRYYLTIRHDRCGYVSVSDDGLHWTELKEWRFDHGLELGSYNTQQHWVIGPDALYLVYTRRVVWNDHVFRNRAPLFMAEVDTDSLTVKRNTERIVVPDRGARLGNFNVTPVDENETWIFAAEWMQSSAGRGEVGAKFCEQYGSDNTIWAAKIHWR